MNATFYFWKVNDNKNTQNGGWNVDLDGFFWVVF